MSDAKEVCRKVVDDIIEDCINDYEEMEMAFLKGHLSPGQSTAPPPQKANTACFELCGGVSECDVCKLPDSGDGATTVDGRKICGCCQRQCKLKYLLFDCIGECLSFKEADTKKCVKLLKHVEADLQVALTEVNDRLSSFGE